MPLRNNPVISVVIPTYNRAPIIGRTIRSVLAQTYRNLEIVVIDDGSSDETKAVIETFEDPRIKYLYRSRNSLGLNRPAAARNLGINNSNGDYIAFIDSDDEWMSDVLMKQVNALDGTSANVGAAYTRSVRLGGGNTRYVPGSQIKNTHGNIHDELLHGNFISISSVTIKRECLYNSGLFDDTMPRLEDWEFLLRISKSYEFVYINEALSVSHIMVDSLSEKRHNFVDAYKLIIDRYLTNRPDMDTALTSHYWYMGHLLCMDGDMKDGRRFLAMALQARPLNPVALLSLAVSMFGSACYNRARLLYRARLKA